MDYPSESGHISIPQELEKTIDLLTSVQERFAGLSTYLDPVLEPERAMLASDGMPTETETEQSRVIEQIRSIQRRVLELEGAIASTTSRLQI